MRGKVDAVQDVDVGEVQAILTKSFGQRVHGPPHPRPPPAPHKEPFYNVSGAGSAEWNGLYAYVSAGRYKSTTCPFCSLYTFGGVWRLAKYGQAIYYEATIRSPDPPFASKQWRAADGLQPTPSLTLPPPRT